MRRGILSYLKSINVFGVSDFKPLCMIDDCLFNKDATCSQGLYSLSEQCDKIRIFPSKLAEEWLHYSLTRLEITVKG